MPLLVWWCVCVIGDVERKIKEGMVTYFCGGECEGV